MTNVTPPPAGMTIVTPPAGTTNVMPPPAGTLNVAPPLADTSNVATPAGTLNAVLPAGTTTGMTYLLASKTNAARRKRKRHNHKKNVKARKLQMKTFGFEDYAQGAAAAERLMAASVRPGDGFGDNAQGTAAAGRSMAASVRPVEWGDDKDDTSSDNAVWQPAVRKRTKTATMEGWQLKNINRVNDDNNTLSDEVVRGLARRRTAVKHTRSFDFGDQKIAPPPKNVEQDIYEYVDRKNKDNFFTTNLL
jgi:hypothetical protein